MKRLFLAIVLPMLSCLSIMAMSDARIRESARFLTDRMAYELHLTPAQYEDCYEVNYDFIASANILMDDVVYGYSDAIDSYYDYLDYRNEDLRYILNATQYGIFMGLDYFFRPIYTTARRWALRIYDVYHNHHYYYYGVPACYHTYHGMHSRLHHHGGFYIDRYSHPHYHVAAPIHHGHAYESHRRSDFGDHYHHRDLHARPNNESHHRHNDHGSNRPSNNGHNGHQGGNGHNGQQGNQGHQGGNGHNGQQGTQGHQGGNGHKDANTNQRPIRQQRENVQHDSHRSSSPTRSSNSHMGRSNQESRNGGNRNQESRNGNNRSHEGRNGRR